MKRMFFLFICFVGMSTNEVFCKTEVACELGTDCLFYPYDEHMRIDYLNKFGNYICHITQKYRPSNLKLYVTWANYGGHRVGSSFDLQEERLIGQYIILSPAIRTTYSCNGTYFDFSAIKSPPGWFTGTQSADQQTGIIVNCKELP